MSCRSRACALLAGCLALLLVAGCCHVSTRYYVDLLNQPQVEAAIQAKLPPGTRVLHAERDQGMDSFYLAKLTCPWPELQRWLHAHGAVLSAGAPPYNLVGFYAADNPERPPWWRPKRTGTVLSAAQYWADGWLELQVEPRPFGQETVTVYLFYMTR